MRGWDADHVPRPRRPTYRDPRRNDPVRPVEEPRVLRLVVRISRQQRPGLGPVRPGRLLVRLPPPPGSLRSRTADRACAPPRPPPPPPLPHPPPPGPPPP